MQAYLTSSAYAFGGGEAGDGWKQLFDSTFTTEEMTDKIESEEAEDMRMLEQQRKERMEQFLRSTTEDGKTVFMQGM